MSDTLANAGPAEIRTGLEAEDYKNHYVIPSHDASVSPAALAVWDEIKRLGLEAHVGEFEALGYTVIPPEKLAPKSVSEELREAILDVAERRTGRRPSLTDEAANFHPETGGFGRIMFGMVLEGTIFEQACQNPTVLAMVTYALGRNAILSSMNAMIKGPGQEPLGLHCDLTRFSAPFPAHHQVLNCVWTLTDYDIPNGSTRLVPGSHRYCRPSMPGEGMDQIVHVEAPAGSLMVWSGHTWHGAAPRSMPGVRVNLTMPFNRPHLIPLEDLRNMVPEEIIARNPPRFRTMMQKAMEIPFGADGPDAKYGAESHAMGRHVYD